MTLRESLSKVGHFMTSPKGHVLTSKRRLLNSLPLWLKSNVLSPLRQPAPAEESPSMNTSFFESGEKLGTIIAVLPSPHVPGVFAVTSIGATPLAWGVFQAA